ncbi:hypothetical protein M569_15804, partial [Genlisea aurea]
SADNGSGHLFGDGVVGKMPRFANKITLRNLSTGMKLWGMIAELNEKDIIVSLPGGLRGLVRACDAVDPQIEDALRGDMASNFLSKLYKEKQLVPCIVLQVEDDRKDASKVKIWLSLRLSVLYKSLTLDAVQEGMVLNAYTQSLEDHGCVLYFGSPSFTGFMQKCERSYNCKTELSMGQIIKGVVTSVDRARRVVHLNSDPEVISKVVDTEPNTFSIDTLSPGMMVNARVSAILDNGLMLSFLSYFTGTVDIFNLSNTIPSSSWRNGYSINMKVKSRILFIDSATRAIGLTLNPSLVGNMAPKSLVKIGDIFDKSKVLRVDKAFGLLVELPTKPPTPAFVSVTDAFDEAVENLDKSFKEGSVVPIRILGYRHLEGLAIGSLKASALKGLVFSHSDVKPGMVVKAKILKVRSSGAIVQFSSGVKAICPLRHMSEFERAKPPKKFQAGVELVFRVLGCRSKRISVTHKKTLVKSKLGILSSYADATDGLVTHGWITKIDKNGCFVRFYNGVEGFVSRSELGLGPDGDIGSLYHVEQVVKCRVVKYLRSSRTISLSFNVTQSRSSLVESMKPGTTVSGVCGHVTSTTVVVNVNGSSNTRGIITLEHLADHHGHAKLFIASLKPGYLFDQLLVLGVEGKNLLLSAKTSLLLSAQQLPVDVTEIRCPSVMHGYICNIIESGCFIRFLGRLTGFAPRSKVTNDRRLNLCEIFRVGQSVRCIAHDVNTESGRITLSLKQSLCCSSDASYAQEYFSMEAKIAKMQALDIESPECSWDANFGICSVVEGKVHEIKDVGAVLSFDKYHDVYGFISHNQLPEPLEVNSIVRAAVLDVSKIDRLVDLSLKPEFLTSFEDGFTGGARSKKRKTNASMNVEVNQAVMAIVEIVKENYLVLSLPDHKSAIGYAMRFDYNTQNLPHKQFVHGQRVQATVLSLPSPSTCWRLLLMLNSVGDDFETRRTKRTKKNHSYDVGSVVQVEITKINLLEVRVKFASGHHGRIHITETTDGNSAETPFSAYTVGETLTAVIVSKVNKRENGSGGYLWELSVKPSLLDGSVGVDKFTKPSEEIDYIYGQPVSGYVYKVDSEWAWLSISRWATAKLFFLDSSCEPSELAEFQKRFSVGKLVSGYVVSVNKEKKLLHLALNKPKDCSSESENFYQHQLFGHLAEGSIIGGRISKILSGVGGLVVQIASHHYGMVNFMELTNSWDLNPLSGYQEGQFVKCEILEINRSAKGTVHVDLSLRCPSCNVADAEHSSDVNIKRPKEIKDLQPDMPVKGYVKSISTKGCYIMLSRKIDAKILICNLSDNYVENPAVDFPIGKLVSGRVRSVEPLSKRVEVTLRTSSVDRGSDVISFDHVSAGTIISGRIKRVESFGLFISIDNTNIVGLCHISEISDSYEEHPETNYAVGQIVSAKVLKVDKDRNRVSLGLKNSYMETDEKLNTPMQQENDLAHFVNDSFLQVESMNGTSVYVPSPIPAEAESRATVPPLEVPLDEFANLDSEVISDQRIEVAGAERNVDKDEKRVKKRARLEREIEIRAAEEKLLEEDIPKNAEEYEKLVRNSPNSSFMWIKYMAHMLSLADVEKARSVAERALQTINFREESEKLNIWVAYFNLENEYGNPPEEAVSKVFQRALQTCDPKKVHLALLGMYERTEQYESCEGLLDKMTRKFKRSSKVWLRKINFLLGINNSDSIQSTVSHALLSLPPHKHVKFISQAAVLEFKRGVPDRGRSLFEGILREYPKRTDVWSIYLDQEIRNGDGDVIRALFERAISLTLPQKKMKFFFKKYLEYEKSAGDKERVESVKRKAMEYVESSMA